MQHSRRDRPKGLEAELFLGPLVGDVTLAAPVLVDLRRTTIYDGSTIETQTLSGSSISASIAIDGTVYTNSQETHNMRIRQQDPVTKLRSMCEINSFLSAGGARCSIRIQWSEYDVAYAAPTV